MGYSRAVLLTTHQNSWFVPVYKNKNEVTTYYTSYTILFYTHLYRADLIANVCCYYTIQYSYIYGILCHWLFVGMEAISQPLYKGLDRQVQTTRQKRHN